MSLEREGTSSTPSESMITFFVGVGESVLLEISIGIESIGIGEISGMTMNSPIISLYSIDGGRTIDCLEPKYP